jgi:hypothetical protein
MTDEKMIDALKKLRIIEHGGCNRWMMSAAKGENYKYFMEMLETKLFGD